MEDLSAYRVRRGMNRIGTAIAVPCWVWAALNMLAAFGSWVKGEAGSIGPSDFLSMTFVSGVLGLLAVALFAVLGWIAAGFTASEEEYQRRRAEERAAADQVRNANNAR